MAMDLRHGWCRHSLDRCERKNSNRLNVKKI
jgi:hypothetical protein